MTEDADTTLNLVVGVDVRPRPERVVTSRPWPSPATKERLPRGEGGRRKTRKTETSVLNLALSQTIALVAIALEVDFHHTHPQDSASTMLAAQRRSAEHFMAPRFDWKR